MNITLSGYGKMGKEVERIAIKKNHMISAIVDHSKDWTEHETDILNSDVIIDFSQPDVVVQNIHFAFNLNMPIVVGTTGWEEHKEEIRSLCLKTNQSIFVASNFSIGVNLFFEINSLLAQLMNDYPDYKPEIEEIHHTQKLDKPSGTAIRLANQIIKRIHHLKNWELDKKHDSSSLPVFSRRIENTPGTHHVTYTSEMDKIEIGHTAFSRQGFAIGAIKAAEWVFNKKGYFGMHDMLKSTD
jgi:4-hydroxy-tetrahydrodipicolinate reductase